MIVDRLDLKTGDLIDDRYKVVNQIGSGSYGDVFKVTDSYGNTYALKLLHLWDIISDLREELVEKFKHEFKTAQISCKNLVHSIDHGSLRGNPYLIMEFCPNGDLDKLSKKDKTKIAYLARDILEGLKTLHSAGLIHRDLKPANVLIKADGTAALTDFGTVGFRDVKLQTTKKIFSTRPKDMKGTPLYMAPEVLERKGGGVTYLPTVDIWSFGVMMYELLTDGSFPFGHIERIEEMPVYQGNARKGIWDKEKIKNIPNGRVWLPIIEKCIAPDYRHRYQSALEIILDLKPLLGNDSLAEKECLNRSTSISRLIITQGQNVGSTYSFNRSLNSHGRMLRVGRDRTNDIVLPENVTTYVSRYHFTLEMNRDGSFWIIRDGQWQKNERRWISSTNGTFLNSTPIGREGLKVYTGDIITVGEYKIKVV